MNRDDGLFWILLVCRPLRFGALGVTSTFDWAPQTPIERVMVEAVVNKLPL